MSISLIEQLDKSRYNLIRWLTIGWTTWFGAFTVKDWIDNKLTLGLLILIGLVGWILFVVSLVNFLRLSGKVNADTRLKEALNNEMHQLYAYKSFLWGFATVITVICILLTISLFYNMPALMVCKIVLFFGISSPLIAGLIYNKG